MHNWISVKDRVPTHGGPFIACSMIEGRDDFNQKGKHYDEDRLVEGGEVKMMLYVYHVDEKLWQNVMGLYDHAITHWIEYIEPPDIS